MYHQLRSIKDFKKSNLVQQYHLSEAEVNTILGYLIATDCVLGERKGKLFKSVNGEWEECSMVSLVTSLVNNNRNLIKQIDKLLLKTNTPRNEKDLLFKYDELTHDKDVLYNIAWREKLWVKKGEVA